MVTFLNGRKTFTAKYGGSCFGCQAQIFPGDQVFYPPAGESVCGVDCCGDRSDAELTPVSNVDDTTPATDQTVPLELVMPRGRTAADRCDKCFMIPSNSGACGCDA